MGKLTVNGMDALIDDLADLAKLPDSVIEGILNAEADVVERAQRKAGAKMWKGPYETGDTAASIKKGKVKKTGLDRSITVAPRGKNKRGQRNAEVAFVNEYGKSSGRQAGGRPAIRTANEQSEKEMVEAGEKVLSAYLDKKNL